jgi:porin
MLEHAAMTSKRLLVMAIAMLGYADPICARDGVDLAIDYVSDVVAVSGGEAPSKLAVLDNLDVTATLDLEALAGMRGTVVHAHLLNNLGAMPNDRAGTLQGIDNIEVASQRLRLFELWAERRIGARTTVRAGLYDLNSEFYANDAAGLLIAPAFGVGSEIAATGPNGPSIFPSTALAVRIERRSAADDYLRVALVNASAGTIGDPQGVDLSFGNGALVIGEVGLSRRGRLALGAWTYTNRQPRMHRLGPDGLPAMARAFGVYATVEWPLVGGAAAAPGVTGFARIGASDGHTTPFCGGWQAGLLWQGVLSDRPDSAISVGANQGRLSRGYRQVLREQGLRPAAAETAFEVTASDRVLPHVTLQPDVQLVLDPGGTRTRRPALVTTLRVALDF